MCKERNYGLAIYDKIFILQNQKFVLQSMLSAQEEQSEFNRNAEERRRIVSALDQLEMDLVREKEKYGYIFQKNYKYYF